MAELISLAQHNRDQDALAIGALYQQARLSAVDSVQHLIEAGRRLIAKKASMQHGEWLPWLAANADVLGFDTPRTAAKLIKAAALKCDVNVPFDEADAVQINRMIWGNPLRGTTGTGDNEWFTPSIYVEAARETMGGIDLDPATHAIAQETVQAAKQFFTIEDNGLDQEWHGRVWLNPPYGREMIGRFINKLIHEIKAGHTTTAIMLTHNYTDTEWFHTAAQHANALCFTLGRVKFLDSDGEPANPTQGQVFYYYGSEINEFAKHFKSFGFIPGLI